MQVGVMKRSRSLQACMGGNAYVKLAEEDASMAICERVSDEGLTPLRESPP